MSGPERLLAGLLVASRLWSRREPLDEQRLREARNAVLLANHSHYVQTIPAYRRLAADLGLLVVNDATTLARNLLIGVALFKSYEDSLLERRDFASLTAWIGDVSTVAPGIGLDGIERLDQWIERLRGSGIFLAMSSGSSGRPSLIPRDRFTLAALRNNGQCYSTLSWGGYQTGQPEYDCLLVVRPGKTLGIQAVSVGLASLARRSYTLSPDDLCEPGQADALRAAAEFVTASNGSGRGLLVFGTPPAVASLCRALLARAQKLQLPPSSLLVTGGGWKTPGPPQLMEEFPPLLDAALGIKSHVDVYGLSECNAYLIRCSEGRYHVPPVLEAVVVDDQLAPLDGDTAVGQIGLLDPFAFSYPGFLLTGDRGRLVRTPCPCGLAGPGFVGEITRLPGREAKGCAGAPQGVVA